MKQLRSLAATAAVLALTFLFVVSSASATTLEVKGVPKNESLSFKFTLKAGTSMLLTDTAGFFANTCTSSTKEGKTEGPFTGASVGGALSTLSFGTEATRCTEGAITVDAGGRLSASSIAGTTNGTVKSSNAKVTVPSALGLLTCTTPIEGTDIGTLTGVASGAATIDINGVMNCGITAKWIATYTVTSPEGLGVVS